MTTVKKKHVDTFIELSRTAELSTAELASHCYNMTLEPDGPQYSFGEFAKAVNRPQQTIKSYAMGYAKTIEPTDSPLGAPDLPTSIAMSKVKTEKADAAKIIADIEGLAVSTVLAQKHSQLVETIDYSRERAAKNNTTVLDEVAEITKRNKISREARKKQQAERKKKHTFWFMDVSGELAKAKRGLAVALNSTEDVAFGAEEQELLRQHVDELRAVLTLIDMRLEGEPDVDWDAELAKLGSVS